MLVAYAPMKNNPQEKTKGGFPNLLSKNNMDFLIALGKTNGIVFGRHYGIAEYFNWNSQLKKKVNMGSGIRVSDKWVWKHVICL